MKKGLHILIRIRGRQTMEKDGIELTSTSVISKTDLEAPNIVRRGSLPGDAKEVMKHCDIGIDMGPFRLGAKHGELSRPVGRILASGTFTILLLTTAIGSWLGMSAPDLKVTMSDKAMTSEGTGNPLVHYSYYSPQGSEVTIIH